ncbi:hypothetical protein [Xanthobacter agilis]|jgi:hypothetical protein|uniref:hypothetical protein n=1 Tax=Xanthobacter agilis TaxID=47492 RepID=UPI00372B5823
MKLWPLAKHGDKKAMRIIASEFAAGDLLPPGPVSAASKPSEKIAHALVLLYYGHDSSHPPKKGMDLFLSELVSVKTAQYLYIDSGEIKFETVRNAPTYATIKSLCAHGGASCLNRLSIDGLIPSFQLYTDAVDRALQGVTITCRREYL